MKYIENKHTELKGEFTKNLRKEIIAFLNTNGGIVYIDIDDNSTLIEIDGVNYLMNQISSHIIDNIYPCICQNFKNRIRRYVSI